MASKNNNHRGVYTVKTKGGTSYGIDYTHPQTGQRVRKVLKGVKSEPQALKYRAIEIADAERGVLNAAYGIKQKEKAVPFAGMVEAYLKWSKENKDSWETDQHRAKPLLKAFRGKLMGDIKPFLVEKYKIGRAKQVAKATVNKELILGSQVFEKAIDWGKWQGENPFLKADRFKIKKRKKPGALSPEQVQAIIAQMPHPAVRDMASFSYYQGWRISEIRKLKWQDVDIERGSAWLVDPKGGSTVEVELGDEALEVLRRQQRRGEYVFCKKNGEPFTTNLQDGFRNAARRAGVALPRGKRWHILRRTWASQFLRNSDVETLRVQGNWKDTSMPLWYAEAAGKAARKRALNKIPSLENGRNMAESGKVVLLNGWNN